MIEPLWQRLSAARRRLAPQAPRYRIIYEDPQNLDRPVAVIVPAPNWLAAAMAGGVLSPVEAHLRDRQREASWRKDHPGERFSWARAGRPEAPYSAPIEAMTEEDAMEYLVMRFVPRRIWQRQRGNRLLFAIVPAESLPTDRRFRNAWGLVA